MRRFAKVECIRHTNLTEGLFTLTKYASQYYAERNVCVCFIIIRKIYMDIFPPQDETHPFSVSNTLKARSVYVSVCTRNDVVT